MKLVCQKAELSKAISRAQSAVSNKTTMPVLGNLLFEANSEGLTITGTDLEIGLRCKVAVEVVQEGAVTIPARKLAEIVKESRTAEIEITVKDGHKVEIKSGKGVYRFMGITAEDFPNLPIQKKDRSVKVADSTLGEMIQKTVFSVSNEETRHVLMGALFQVEGKKMRMVSTDGHRLSYVEKDITPASQNVHAIVPAKAMHEMAKALDGADGEVELSFTDNHVFLEKNDFMLVSRLIDGQFPNYDQVIPKKTDVSFTVLREEFEHVVKAVALMASDRSNNIKVNLKPGEALVHAVTPDVGEAEESCEIQYQGGEMTIAFNARYVLDALRAMGGEKVEFRLSGPLSPALLVPAAGADSKFVIMPMRT